MSTAHKKSTNKTKSDVTWSWAEREWENSVPTKKNLQPGLGKAKHTGCCLGLAVTSVFVRLRRPSAQSRQLEGSMAGVEGQRSAKSALDRVG